MFLYLHPQAEVAQLVELQPSKLVVASSSLVFRSKPFKFWRVFLFPFFGQSGGSFSGNICRPPSGFTRQGFSKGSRFCKARASFFRSLAQTHKSRPFFQNAFCCNPYCKMVHKKSAPKFNSKTAENMRKTRNENCKQIVISLYGAGVEVPKYSISNCVFQNAFSFKSRCKIGLERSTLFGKLWIDCESNVQLRLRFKNWDFEIRRFIHALSPVTLPCVKDCNGKPFLGWRLSPKKAWSVRPDGGRRENTFAKRYESGRRNAQEIKDISLF